jgi:hypothetical protein
MKDNSMNCPPKNGTENGVKKESRFARLQPLSGRDNGKHPNLLRDEQGAVLLEGIFAVIILFLVAGMLFEMVRFMTVKERVQRTVTQVANVLSGSDNWTTLQAEIPVVRATIDEMSWPDRPRVQIAFCEGGTARLRPATNGNGTCGWGLVEGMASAAPPCPSSGIMGSLQTVTVKASCRYFPIFQILVYPTLGKTGGSDDNQAVEIDPFKGIFGLEYQSTVAMRNPMDGW